MHSCRTRWQCAAARYSEDIELVCVGDRLEGPIMKALIRVLRPVLGKGKVIGLGSAAIGGPQRHQSISDPALHLQSAKRDRT
jgi:hypothetical protein